MKDALTQNRTILIVDDEPLLCEIVGEALTPLFSKVCIAHNGTQALEIMAKETVDIVLTDYNMPEMNGLDLIDRIKAASPLVPVIMITGSSQDPMVLEAIKKGAFDIITKPFAEEVLINRVRNSLLFPQLVQVLWAVMSKELSVPKVETFLAMTFEDQLKALYSYSGLLRTRSVKSSMRPS